MKKKRKNSDDFDNTKEIIDLTKFIYPEISNMDENGSYTGVTKETYLHGVPEQPIQDADDL